MWKTPRPWHGWIPSWAGRRAVRQSVAVPARPRLVMPMTPSRCRSPDAGFCLTLTVRTAVLRFYLVVYSSAWQQLIRPHLKSHTVLLQADFSFYMRSREFTCYSLSFFFFRQGFSCVATSRSVSPHYFSSWWISAAHSTSIGVLNSLA